MSLLPLEPLGRAVSLRLGWTLLHSLWQGAVVSMVLAVGLKLLRGYSATTRHAACLAALLILTVTTAGTLLRTEKRTVPTLVQSTGNPPVVNAEWSGDKRVLPEAEQRRQTSVDGGDKNPLSLHPAALGAKPADGNFIVSTWRGRLDNLLPWLSACWAFGVALLSLRHLGGWVGVRRLRRSGAEVQPALQRVLIDLCGRYQLQSGAVRLLETAEAGMPMLLGLFRPIILLPTQAVTGLDAHQLEAILAHELAHLVRRDTWTNLVVLAVETMFFYHPAVWWVGRRLREERELAADDLALCVCDDRRLYARALARLADFQQSVPTFALGATGSGRGSLLFRIRRVLNPSAFPSSAVLEGWDFALSSILTAMLLGLAWIAHVKAGESKVINVLSGQSIQAAIDSAPAGAVIRLGTGEWKENIVFTKPLTLEGAGWDRTRLVAGEVPPMTRAANLDYQARSKAAHTTEEKSALVTEQIEKYDRPAVWVHDTRGVILRALRVQGRKSDGPRGSATLGIFQRGTAVVDACAFVGPAANGMTVGQGADVEVKSSLITAMGNDGITVSGYDEDHAGKPGGLHLVDSEVRNAYYAGVVLGAGCDSTLIERSRISGSAWHGIRYDDASPTITGCTIFAEARSGIYASGKTKATIRGNLFYENEMDGISAWFENADLIEGNTFVNNLREGVAVVGAKPTLTRNVFTGNPVAIVCSQTSSRNGLPTAVGDPIMLGNLFWKNQEILQKGKPEDFQSVPEGSLQMDPRFKDAAMLDFALASDSPARGLGATAPLPPGGPWPLLAEEKAMIPTGATRDFRSWRFSAPKNIPVVTMPTPRPPEGDTRAARLQAINASIARQRAAQDRQIYTAEQLQEIEQLYQVANQKGLRSEESRASLRQLLEKYDKANRTGCATLYYGQGSEGAERLEYLTRAVERFSDCYYFNGCQVGGFARYLLALSLWEAGQKDKARTLVNELRTTYKDATDHHGQPMTVLADEAEKTFAERP